jgi:uncharacterized protein YodC (DUF2158 family)
MSEEISTGDVVMLKSGGPTMTVDSVGDRYGTISAFCTWFDGKRKQSDAFPLTSIEIVE